MKGLALGPGTTGLGCRVRATFASGLMARVYISMRGKRDVWDAYQCTACGDWHLRLTRSDDRPVSV